MSPFKIMRKNFIIHVGRSMSTGAAIGIWARCFIGDRASPFRWDCVLPRIYQQLETYAPVLHAQYSFKPQTLESGGYIIKGYIHTSMAFIWWKLGFNRRESSSRIKLLAFQLSHRNNRSRARMKDMEYFHIRYTSSGLGKYNRITSASGQNKDDAENNFKEEFKKLHGCHPVVHEVTPFNKNELSLNFD